MQYSFVRGAPSQPPLFTWESLHYLILELPPLRPSDSSSDSVVLAESTPIAMAGSIARRGPAHERPPRPPRARPNLLSRLVPIRGSPADRAPVAGARRRRARQKGGRDPSGAVPPLPRSPLVESPAHPL